MSTTAPNANSTRCLTSWIGGSATADSSSWRSLGCGTRGPLATSTAKWDCDDPAGAIFFPDLRKDEPPCTHGLSTGLTPSTPATSTSFPSLSMTRRGSHGALSLPLGPGHWTASVDVRRRMMSFT